MLKLKGDLRQTNFFEMLIHFYGSMLKINIHVHGQLP